MTVDDRYLTWDAAYVLGALSTDDRLEYVVPENLAIAGRIVLDLLDQIAAQATIGPAFQ